MGSCAAMLTAAHTAAVCQHDRPRVAALAGRADSWENLVACCLRCNNTKGDRTPDEMSWTLRLTPRPPHGTAWLVRGVDRDQPQWQEYLMRCITWLGGLRRM